VKQESRQSVVLFGENLVRRAKEKTIAGALQLWKPVAYPKQPFRTEGELFWQQRRMVFRQNRTEILVTPVKSAGGAAASFGASCFLVRKRCFFLRTALKSSEHRVFHAGMGKTIPALGALGLHRRRRIRRISRFGDVIAFRE